MQCEKVREYLSAFQLGELCGEEAQEVSAHLKTCPGCQKELEQLNKSWELLSAWEDQSPPAGLMYRLKEQIYRQGKESIFVHLWQFKMAPVALSLVLLLIGFFGGWSMKDYSVKSAMLSPGKNTLEELTTPRSLGLGEMELSLVSVIEGGGLGEESREFPESTLGSLSFSLTNYLEPTLQKYLEEEGLSR